MALLAVGTLLPWLLYFTGKGIVVIFAGLMLRVFISMVVVSGNGFNYKERIMIAVAWIPKATVQVRYNCCY